MFFPKNWPYVEMNREVKRKRFCFFQTKIWEKHKQNFEQKFEQKYGRYFDLEEVLSHLPVGIFYCLLARK